MTSLDTNIVLRFLLGDIPDQTDRATKLIENRKVYVTDVVLIEVVYVLEKVYELPRKDICDLVLDFLNFSNVAHNPRFLLDIIALYKNHPSLSMVDCYACEEARSYGNELVTYDKRLVNQGGAHVRILK
jgi:predicted nucleic acid-binding protein